jgi:hypothetical protein
VHYAAAPHAHRRWAKQQLLLLLHACEKHAWRRGALPAAGSRCARAQPLPPPKKEAAKLALLLLLQTHAAACSELALLDQALNAQQHKADGEALQAGKQTRQQAQGQGGQSEETQRQKASILLLLRCVA